MMLARLDRMLKGLMRSVEEDAADSLPISAILQIEDRRAKLLGLYDAWIEATSTRIAVPVACWARRFLGCGRTRPSCGRRRSRSSRSPEGGQAMSPSDYKPQLVEFDRKSEEELREFIAEQEQIIASLSGEGETKH
jgi:hypothetical protein